MNFLLRGLCALVIMMSLQTTLSAQYLYKDEVVLNPKFNAEIEKIGSELYSKTGISLKLIMLKKLSAGQSIVDYEKELIKNFSEPTILLTFSEKDAKVDILANPPSLYEYFNKKQILSPIASPAQAFFIALLNLDFSDMTSGGTILPLLAQKTKNGEHVGKYSASMFNGYADIAEQVAESKGIVLENAIGNANQTSIFIVKIVFYGIILIAVFMYIKRRIYYARQKK